MPLFLVRIQIHVSYSLHFTNLPTKKLLAIYSILGWPNGELKQIHNYLTQERRETQRTLNPPSE